MAAFAPLDCLNTQRMAQREHGMHFIFIYPQTHRINMEAPNERVERHMAFWMFNLQINWLSLYWWDSHQILELT